MTRHDDRHDTRSTTQAGVTDPGHPDPGHPDPAPARPAPRGVSMPTVVLGLVLAVVAGAVLVRELTGRTLDVELTGPPLLLAAGVVLVLWALVGLARQTRRTRDAAGGSAL